MPFIRRQPTIRRIGSLRRGNDYRDMAINEDDCMSEAAKTRAEALFKRREAERAEFEAQLQAQRDENQRLRALRLAREEARWAEHRPKVIQDIKEGLIKDSRNADKTS
jgi:hypothetical protein